MNLSNVWQFQMTQRGNMKKNLTSGICKQCKPDTDKKKKRRNSNFNVCFFLNNGFMESTNFIMFPIRNEGISHIWAFKMSFVNYYSLGSTLFAQAKEKKSWECGSGERLPVIYFSAIFYLCDLKKTNYQYFVSIFLSIKWG